MLPSSALFMVDSLPLKNLLLPHLYKRTVSINRVTYKYIIDLFLLARFKPTISGWVDEYSTTVFLAVANVVIIIFKVSSIIK